MRRVRAGALALASLLLVAADRAPPPALELRTLEGRRVALAPESPEQALVVHFWASWCEPCREELPALARAAAPCAPAKLRVVAVNAGEDEAVVRRFADGIGLALPLLRDPGGRVWRSLGMRELPANLVWQGETQRRLLGPSDEAQWRARFVELGCADAAPPGAGR